MADGKMRRQGKDVGNGIKNKSTSEDKGGIKGYRSCNNTDGN